MICEILAGALQDIIGISETEAAELAGQVIAWGAAHGYAGTRHYWPARVGLTAAERDEAIRREFTGSNLREICERFGVSHETVYRARRG